MSTTLEAPQLQTYACLPADILHIDAPQAFALDFDRTLARINGEQDGRPVGSMNRLLAVSAIYGIDAKVIHEAQSATEADGGTFEPVSYIASQLSSKEFADLHEEYVKNTDVPVLYEDAPPLLSRLQELRIPNLIMTYGVSAEWQRWKVEAGNVEQHAEIMSHSRKGPEIQSWQSRNGTYEFVGVTSNGRPLAVFEAQAVTLVDDKAKSLHGLPKNCSGVLLSRPGEIKLASQMGDVPENARTVSSLDEVQVSEDMQPKFDSRSASVVSHIKRFIPLRSFVQQEALVA